VKKLNPWFNTAYQAKFLDEYRFTLWEVPDNTELVVYFKNFILYIIKHYDDEYYLIFDYLLAEPSRHMHDWRK
jgi:hypothetical protein